jgi:hypothetical protein
MRVVEWRIEMKNAGNTNTPRRKLRLSRQTLRQISNADLVRAAGGVWTKGCSFGMDLCPLM